MEKELLRRPSQGVSASSSSSLQGTLGPDRVRSEITACMTSHNFAVSENSESHGTF